VVRPQIKNQCEEDSLMFAMKEKKSLFGGTLRCAGLAAAATMASPALADFQSIPGYGTPNYTFNYTVDAAGGLVIFDYDLNYAGGFPLDTLNFTNYATLIAYSNPGAMGAGVTAYGLGGYSYMGATVWQYFTVGNNAKRGTVYWDLTAGNQYALVYMYQFGVGAILNEVAGSSGSQHFVFTAGETYALIIRANMSAPINGDSVYGVLVWEVPAPGALALLGVAGMVGKRRRRRE